jgi:yecA family protein
MDTGARRTASCRHQHCGAGRMSINPLDWICPLLAVDADAFNHGDTPEFAAISAVARHHNDISNALSTVPHRFQPAHARKPNGDVDARPWCQGFHAAMRLRLQAWAPLLNLSNHGLLLPILLHCVDDHGRSMLGPARKGRETETPAPISRWWSRRCANTGCRAATPEPADYSSYRLLKACSSLALPCRAILPGASGHRPSYRELVSIGVDGLRWTELSGRQAISPRPWCCF